MRTVILNILDNKKRNPCKYKVQTEKMTNFVDLHLLDLAFVMLGI